MNDSLPHETGPESDQPVDQVWMQRAFELAHQAALAGEIPVGAVLIYEDEIIAEAGNFKESSQDPLGHAEIRVIQQAAQKLGRWRLSGCTLYVTLEPCLMCAGAIIHARIDRLVYGTFDPKAGAVHSIYQVLQDPRLNHAPKVTAGVLEGECRHQLKTFFRDLRRKPTKLL